MELLCYANDHRAHSAVRRKIIWYDWLNLIQEGTVSIFRVHNEDGVVWVHTEQMLTVSFRFIIDERR